MATALAGVSSAALRITVQPAASAGASLRLTRIEGKFQAVSAATTPTGSGLRRWRKPTGGAGRGANRVSLIARGLLGVPLEGLDRAVDLQACLHERLALLQGHDLGQDASRRSAISAAARRRIAARSKELVWRQSAKAAWAAASASSISAGSARGSSAKGALVRWIEHRLGCVRFAPRASGRRYRAAAARTSDLSPVHSWPVRSWLVFPRHRTAHRLPSRARPFNKIRMTYDANGPLYRRRTGRSA